MTSFIDCYSSLDQQINKITITSTSFKNIEEEEAYFQSKFMSMLSVLAEKIDNKKSCLIQKKDHQIYQLSFLYDTLYPGLDLFCKLQINRNSFQIFLVTTILKNNIPLRIKEKQIRLSVNRYLIRINAIIKYGGLRLNPFNGQITFYMNSFLSMYQFQALIFQPLKLVQIVEEQILKTRHYIRMHIYKILYLMNQIGENFDMNPNLIQFQIKSVNSFAKATIRLLQKITPFVHLQFPFMYHQQNQANSSLKALTPDMVKKMNQNIKMLKYNSKLIETNVSDIMQTVAQTKFQIKNHSSFVFIQQEKKDLTNILLSPFVRHSTGQPPYVYSQIQVKSTQNQIKWEIIDQGGFGVISKGFVKFVYKKDIQKYHPRKDFPFNRILVKKQDHQHNNKSKLFHQKQILNHLKHRLSPFIAKFFYSQQEKFKHSLFIQFCPQKSLSNVRTKNKQFMTLNTKLIFLKYTAQSLKFLKDNKICHLDLKPSNILFGSAHIKLSDFGEAYHPDVCPKNFRPGTSLPYAPPQSFSQDLINFSDRMDVFSFGILMHQMLYDCYPLDYFRHRYNQLKKMYIQKNYMEAIYFAPQKCEYIGYKKIYEYLTYVVLRCLHYQQKKRPSIEWIIVILQCCISLQQHLNYW